MLAGLDPAHATRYAAIARLLVKHGRSDWVKAAGLDGILADDPLGPHDPALLEEAEQLTADLEAMGPTYVKLGQLLASRADLLPREHVQALSRLHDAVEPVGFDVVERTVQNELGVRLSRAFDEFDEVPLASASLGQVHRALLRGGREVAVKVQRPDVREQVFEDMETLREVAGLLDRRTRLGQSVGLEQMLEEFRRSLVGELDYLHEAAELTALQQRLKEFHRIVVPRPYPDFTTSRVLTMDLLHGRKVTEVGPLRRLDTDGTPLVDELFRAYLKQILEDGVFHADPHPGNVLLLDDDRLGLVDVGMVARVPSTMQDALIRLLLAVSEGDGEAAAHAVVRLGRPQEDFDQDRLTRDVAELVARTYRVDLDDLDAGTVVLEVSRAAGTAGLRPPPELAMLGKALLNLDQVARALDPAFRPGTTLREQSARLLQHRMQWSRSDLVDAALDAKEFVAALPGRVNRVMDAVADGRFELRVRAFDETELLHGFHKVANRVTTGIVLAALIIGAAMLSGVRGGARVAGYPAVAFVLFVLAALGGLVLVVSIAVEDRRVRRRRVSGSGRS